MKLAKLKSLIMIPVVLSAALLVAVAANAHERGSHPKKHVMQMLRQLDLSMEQKMSLRSVMRDTKDQVLLLREDMRKMRSEVMELLTSGNVSQQSIDAVLNQYEPMLRLMMETQGNTKNTIYGLLNDEQREKALQLMQQKMDRFEARDTEKRLNKIAEKLDFSSEQLSTANELLPAIVEARSTLKETIKDVNQTQRDLITSGTYSEQQVDEVFSAHFADFKVNVFVAIEAHMQMFQLLNDEQKEKVKAKGARLFLPKML